MKKAGALLMAACVAVCAALTPAPAAVRAEAAEWKEAEETGAWEGEWSEVKVEQATEAESQAEEQPRGSGGNAASAGGAGADEACTGGLGAGDSAPSTPGLSPTPAPSADVAPTGQSSASGDNAASAGEPGVGEPSTGEAGIDEPGAGEPGVGEPSTGEAGIDEPGAGEPGVSESGTGESSTGAPAPIAPIPTPTPAPSEDAAPTGQPSASGDNAASTGEAGVGEPSPGEPDVSEPGTCEPDADEPAPGGPASTPSPAPSPDAPLTVTPLQEDQPLAWRNTAPTFTLYSSLIDLTGFTYAVSVDGGTPTPFEGDSYTPAREGAYALTFSLLDAAGAVVAQSAEYPVWLDVTPPEVHLSTNGLALTITASDAGSGPAGVSLDGGQSWQPMQVDEDGTCRFLYTAGEAQTLDAGMVAVRDAVGNITTNREPVTLARQQERPEGSFPGAGFSGGGGRRGGGGSGGTTRTVSHAASDTSEVVAYDGVALVVQESAMTCLTLGGETLELSVRRADEDSGAAVPFTAELGLWNGELESAGDADTLILTIHEAGSEAGQYEWLFNGAVSRKLAASGIDYLVLRVGERVTALSTAGFTAGRAYDLLRSAGVASKAFEYSLRMAEDVRQPLSLTVTVEDDSFLVTENPEDDLYYYDLYTGPEALLDTAFGAYTPMG